MFLFSYLFLSLSQYSLLFSVYSEQKPITTFYNIDTSQGYSTFKRFLSPKKCFKATKRSSNSYTMTKISDSFKYIHDISEVFGLDDIYENLHYLLQSSKLMEFYNVVRDDVMSWGFNFHSICKTTYTFTYDYNDLLSDEGKKMMSNKENKQKFLYECGDYLIRKYQSGAGLIYTIKINLPNSDEKRILIQTLQSEKSKFQKVTYQNILSLILNFFRKNYITQGNIELYAIQIGGQTTNELIRKSTEDGTYLLQRCSFNDVKPCMNIINTLWEYAINFETIFCNERQMIPLESLQLAENVNTIPIINENIQKIEYYDRIDNSKDIMLKRMFLYQNIEEIKTDLSYLQRIIDFYPIKINEINNFYNKLSSYYENMIKGNKLFLCYRNLINDDRCYQEIKSALNYKDMKEQMKLFFGQSFSIENTYTFTFAGNYCLPPHLKWEKSGELIFIFYGNDFFITNNFGLKCEKIEKENIEYDIKVKCTDGIFIIILEIKKFINDEDGDYYLMIECKEETFWYNEQDRKFAIKVQRSNLFNIFYE